MEVLNLFTNNLVILLSLIGILSFFVSVITEVTKGISLLKRIPTDLQVITLSIMLCLSLYFAYLSYSGMTFQWYYIIACVIAAFMVSFVSMYGWEKFTSLYERFKK